jgi:primosomal protein N'
MEGSLRSRLSKLEAAAEIIGPTPCFFRKERGEYRWQILIRAADPTNFIPEEIPEGWLVDVDPVTLL